MSEPLRKRLRQALAIGLLAVLLTGVAVLAVFPIVSHLDGLRTEVERQRDVLGRFEAFAQASNDGTAEPFGAAAGFASLFLDGETEALQTANLQEALRAIAAQHGTRLSSARPLPVREVDGLRLIGVQAEMDVDTARLQGVILSIEASRPVKFIGGLNVTPGGVARAQSDELRLRVDVYAAPSPLAAGKRS